MERVVSILRLLLRHKRLNFAIKLLVVMVFAWTIYQQVFAKDELQDIWANFKQQLRHGSLWYLASAALLMPANWLMEILKWRILMRRVEAMPLWRSTRAVMTGVTVSILTPNRVGEYGGRILYVDKRNNWRTVVATMVGSFSQLAVLQSFGLLSLAMFLWHFRLLESPLIGGLVAASLGYSGLLLLCYFNIRLVVGLLRRLRLPVRYLKHLFVLRHYSSAELLQALGYALVRYAIYSLQYYLLLRFFGIDVALLPGLAAIGTIYLVQTSVPMPVLLGMLVRGKVALDVWGYFHINELSILTATFSLWVWNIILPALIGLLMVVRVNVVDTLGLEGDEAPKAKP